MHRRQPWPVRWLMTDERLGDRLWQALQTLPPGSGVVFRHYLTPPAERRRLLRRIERIATARRLVLLVADGDRRHLNHGAGPRPASWPAHSRREAIAGVSAGATLLFVSPIYPTRSHPGASALGPMRAARIGRHTGATIIALGGMDERRWRRVKRLGFEGWAAIDAWISRVDQKRKIVPT